MFQIDENLTIIDAILQSIDLDEDAAVRTRYINSTFILQNAVETWDCMPAFIWNKDFDKVMLAKMTVGSLPVLPKMFKCIIYLFGKILNISISILCASCIFTSLSDGSQDTILSPYSIILVSHCGELYFLRQRGFKKICLGMSMLYVFYTSLGKDGQITV